jgi:hypothetical protein
MITDENGPPLRHAAAPRGLALLFLTVFSIAAGTLAGMIGYVVVQLL